MVNGNGYRFHYDDFPPPDARCCCCAGTRRSPGTCGLLLQPEQPIYHEQCRIHRTRRVPDNARQRGGQRRPVGRHRLGRSAASCAKVTTVLASSSVDPHDYEPSPVGRRRPSRAPSSSSSTAPTTTRGRRSSRPTSAPDAPVVDAGVVDKTPDGRQPAPLVQPDGGERGRRRRHRRARASSPPDAATTSPTSARHSPRAMQPYADADRARSRPGRPVRPTPRPRGVFDYMAAARRAGQQDAARATRTPRPTRRDPSPRDLDAFRTRPGRHQIDVLIYNTQTEGSVPEQIRTAAEAAGVPVVDVTETVAAGHDFVRDVAGRPTQRTGQGTRCRA